MQFHRTRTLGAAGAVLALATCLSAQQPASSAGSAGAGSTRGTTGNNPAGNIPGNTTGNIPGTNRFPGSTTQQQGNPGYQTPMFLAGSVLLDDGTPPNSNIRIERVCGNDVHLESHTDSRGRFYFQVGQNSAFDTDASTSGFENTPGFGSRGGSNSTGGFGGNTTGSNSSRDQLWNCELRASYPGYSSDNVRLAGRQPLDRPDVGTIVLHHLGAAAGTTVSVTTALAPKNAQKAYQKGLQLAQKGKLDDALQRLKEATDTYPKYAIAWYALGQLQQRQGQLTEARKSYESAVASDSHYVNPYDQLARLAAQQGNWEDAARFSKQAIHLNPVEFPSSFWYNALASYQLKNASDAEQSARDLLKLDTRHYYPQAENLMGQLLMEKGNYTDAASHLRNYLALVPNATNADTIKQLLTKMDGQNALTKATPAPPQ